MTDDKQNNEGAETTTDAADESVENAEQATVESQGASEESSSAIESQPSEAATAKSDEPETFVYWPVEKDHGSVTRMLTRQGDDVDLSGAGGGMGRALLNLILVTLIAGVTGVGIVQYEYEASDKTLERKSLKRQALEEGHLRLQQKKQKSYGILRVESTPDRASVRMQVMDVGGAASDVDLNQGEEKTAGEAAVAATQKKNGIKQPKLTPMNIMNLDISKVYMITVEREGYLPYSYVVGGKHIWTKDGSSGEYKFVKNVELFAAPCEYWFLYDAEKKEELQFPENGPCEKHYTEATKRQVAVTECTCKMLAPGQEKADSEDKK